MAMIRKMESNAGSQGYMPEVSSTVKSLGISAAGYESFDLGDDYRLVDNLAISLVNFTSVSGATVFANFADTKEALVSANNAPPNTLNGVAPNGIRVSLTVDPAFAGFSLKVTARYFRVKVINGAALGSATAYIDVRGYGLSS